MTDFKSLGRLLPVIEDAEVRYSRKTAKPHDDEVIVAAIRNPQKNEAMFTLEERDKKSLKRRSPDISSMQRGDG